MAKGTKTESAKKAQNSPKVLVLGILLGAIIIVAVYFLMYKPNIEEAESIESSNVTLSKRVDELKVFYDNLDYYNGEIDTMHARIMSRLNCFPADVREEDAIAIAIGIEDSAEVDIPSVNIGSPALVRSIPEDLVTACNIDELQEPIEVNSRTISFSNEVDYDNLKQLLTALEDKAAGQRMSVTSFSYSAAPVQVEEEEEDEEATEGGEEAGAGEEEPTEDEITADSPTPLSGSLEIQLYSATGTGREYVPDKFWSNDAGLPQIFGPATVE